MARVKLKHFARPDMVSDPDWEQGMEVAVKYIEKKISRLNHCGALDEGVFVIPTAEHFVFGAFWRNRSIPTQFRTSESTHSVMKMTMEWP